MNRRELFVLGTGLVVGEPVRRAYSFLNGFGLGADLRTARERMSDFIQAELAKSLRGTLMDDPEANLRALKSVAGFIQTLDGVLDVKVGKVTHCKGSITVRMVPRSVG